MLNGFLYALFLVLFVIFIGIMIIVSVLLFIKAKERKMKNLFIVGLGFIALPIGFIGDFAFNLGAIFLEVFVFICFVLAVVFTNMTFYKDRQKEANIVLIITVVLGVIQLILIIINIDIEINRPFEYYLRISLDFLYIFLVFNWLGFSSYTAFKRFRDQEIEPWIKARYKMITVFSFIMSFHGIPVFFQPIGVRWGDPSNVISLLIFGITSILTFIFSVGFLLAWLMPNWLKDKLNKDYEPKEDRVFSEEDLMRIIKKQLKKDN